MFTVVGERINTTREKVQKAVISKDATYIKNDVKKQTEAGADYIDINAGARIGQEKEDVKWLLEVVQMVTDLPLCIDSPDPEVLEMACGMVKKSPMINSISLEKERFEAMIPFLKGKDYRIIALCMDDPGMPKSPAEIFDRAFRIVAELEKIGIKRDNIFVDPLVQPLGVSNTNGVMIIEAVSRIMKEIPGIHTIVGLSNISYGLPQRRIINRSFLVMLMAYGLDAAIIDPLDRDLMSALRTAEMIRGNDDFCMNYLKGVREGKIIA